LSKLKEARISLFFDRKKGGNSESALFTALNLRRVGVDYIVPPMPDFCIPLNKVLDKAISETFFIEYPGSLPYPPCTPDVQWFLLNAPQPISDAQLETVQSYFKNDYRKVQPGGAQRVDKNVASNQIC
jgi:hypothetical protein